MGQSKGGRKKILPRRENFFSTMTLVPPNPYAKISTCGDLVNP